MEWYQDLLVNMLNSVTTGVEGGVAADAVKTPEQYSPEMFQAMVTVHNVAVKPVTSVVLSIMFVLMLAQTSVNTEGDKQLGVRIVAATMFKIVIVFTVAQSSLMILNGIAGAAAEMSKAAMKVKISGGTAVKLGDALAGKIGQMDLMQCLFVMSVLLLPFILASLATVIVMVLVLLRVLQMDLLIAFSSLPIAFFGHPDTKQFAIGYLRSFAVTAISGTVLILAIKLAQAVGPGLFNGAQEAFAKQDVAGGVVQGYASLLGPPVVLILLFFTANGVAKKIFGEG